MIDKNISVFGKKDICRAAEKQRGLSLWLGIRDSLVFQESKRICEALLTE
ncbi:hypothetical protein [Capnocytophaga granulosa]|nr:MAG TPA: hypothetical protein [Caudoviricetes sp.]